MPNRAHHVPFNRTSSRILPAHAMPRSTISFAPMMEPNTHSPLEAALGHLRDKSVAVYIDGSNFYATVKGLDIIPDYRKLRDIFGSFAKRFVMHYFVATNHDHPEIPTMAQETLSWMARNGYVMHHKWAKPHVDATTGELYLKGNMDIEIAVEALNVPDSVEHVVLMTGDGDFCALVRALKAKGKTVTVISSTQGARNRTAEDLIYAADRFVDFATFRSEIARDIHNVASSTAFAKMRAAAKRRGGYQGIHRAS